MQKIVTHHECPPIPDRRFDWCAHFDGEEEAGNYGYGATKAEAVADFIENNDRLCACERCGGSGRGPSAPTGPSYLWNEVDFIIADRLRGAVGYPTWDDPVGWDERDEVECPVCGGSGWVQS